MAYIDGTLVQKCLDDLSSENLIGNENDTFISLAEAKDRIEELPTADVVPKSEVEVLQKKIDDYVVEVFTLDQTCGKLKAENEKLKGDVEVWKQSRFNLYQRLELYEMAREKVAGEIFEEIEAEITAALKNNYARRNECNAETDLLHTANISGKIACLRRLADFVAELKKKYTEQKND